MKRNLTSIICINILIVVLLMGCSPKNTVVGSGLSVYLNQNDPMRNIIESYNLNCDESDKIQITSFRNSEELSTKISTEMMAGYGPDLITHFSIFGGNLPYLKFIQKNAFMDIQELIENDNSDDKINFEDLNRVVMDSGIYSGKRVFIPLSYSAEILLTTKEMCEEYNVILDPPITYDNINDRLMTFVTAAKKKNNMYTFVPISIAFANLIDDDIDIVNKSSNLDSKEFKDNFYRLHDIYIPFKKKNFYQPNEGLANGTYLFSAMSDMGSRPNITFDFYCDFIKKYSKTPVLVNKFPSKNNQISAQVDSFLAINNNSQKKESAYKFIKYALQYNTQIKLATNAIPVSNSAYEYFRENVINFTDVDISQIDVDIENFLNKYEGFVKNINICRLKDAYYLIKIVSPCLEELFAGKVDEEQCIKNLISKTNIYLNE